MSKDRQLIAAVTAGAIAQVSELIEAGADVNSKHEDSEGFSNRTPLIYAAKGGHLDIVKLLLAAGADHKAKDRFVMPSEEGGETALHHAINGHHHEVVAALLAAGANVNAKSSSETPLMAAIRMDSARLVQLLLEHGANPNAHKDGFTALGTELFDGKIDVVRTLLQNGADPDFQEQNFKTSHLMAAAESGNVEIVRALLGANANVNLRNYNGMTALMAAASGDDVAPMAKQGSALRLAANKASDAIALLLLEAGAEVDARTPSGWSALMLATDHPARGRMVKTLLRAGAAKEGLDWIPVIKAVQADKPWKKVKLLYNKVTNPAIRILAGHPLPHWVRNPTDRSAMIRSMVERGVDPNLGSTDTDDADCLLKYAIEDEDTELVQWLIREGANPNLTARNGKSVLANCYPSKGMVKAIREETGSRLEPEAAVQAFIRPDLREASLAAEFQRAIQALARKMSGSPNALRPLELGGFELDIQSDAATDILLKRHDSLRAQGVYAIATDSKHKRLALLPTNSWATAVAWAQTSAPNFDLTTPQIIKRLQQLELDVPFVIIAAGDDFLEGRFLAAAFGSRKVAQFLYDLCPDMVDQGAGTIASSAEELKRTKGFFLWWD